MYLDILYRKSARRQLVPCVPVFLVLSFQDAHSAVGVDVEKSQENMAGRVAGKKDHLLVVLILF